MVLDDTKPVTQKVLFETLLDFYEQIIGPQFEKIETRFNKAENQLSSLKTDVSQLKNDTRDTKRDISDLKTDLPANADVENLKERVAKLEKVSAAS